LAVITIWDQVAVQVELLRLRLVQELMAVAAEAVLELQPMEQVLLAALIRITHKHPIQLRQGLQVVAVAAVL
jgi:hypothetical protein